MPAEPSIASFAAITRRVIARDGFDGFLPTVLYPARKVVIVLEGVPASEAVEPIAIRWASEGAHEDEPFLLAFRVDPDHFKVFHRVGSVLTHATFAVAAES
ncbi:MAG: hypothetical protein U0529_14370 [Thermoanaerobaculia bacterium]